MIRDFSTDKAWSDRYMPAIKRILAPLLFVESPADIDASYATDLLVLNVAVKSIACRVRRPGYADRYPWDFTIRSHRDTGAKTELAKIKEGWCDWSFYGHASTHGDGVSRWMVIDLEEFRASISDDETKARISYSMRDNKDGTRFIAFDSRSFPRALIVSSSHPAPGAKQMRAWQ